MLLSCEFRTMLILEPKLRAAVVFIVVLDVQKNTVNFWLARNMNALLQDQVRTGTRPVPI